MMQNALNPVATKDTAVVPSPDVNDPISSLCLETAALMARFDSTHQFVSVDTSTILNDPNSIFAKQNGKEIIGLITATVQAEINKLLGNGKFYRQKNALADLIRARRYVIVGFDPKHKDNQILSELFALRDQGIKNLKFNTADTLLAAQAEALGIEVVFEEIKPNIPRAIEYTGFLPKDSDGYNYFYWNDVGKPVFCGIDGEEIVDYVLRPWKLKPRNVYQNLALYLMLNEDIPLVTVQSKAGFGKTHLALVAAFYQVLQLGTYRKIFFVKPTYEASETNGYLPGDLNDKVNPHMRSVHDLVLKLNGIRSVKIFDKANVWPPVYNHKVFEILLLNFIRGMNVENSLIIFDEMQNADEGEARALLTRGCEHTKIICLGDVTQRDRKDLNPYKNALNRAVIKFAGDKRYAHFVLTGDHSRGPVCDLVNQTGY